MRYLGYSANDALFRIFCKSNIDIDNDYNISINYAQQDDKTLDQSFAIDGTLHLILQYIHISRKTMIFRFLFQILLLLRHPIPPSPPVDHEADVGLPKDVDHIHP